MINEKVALDKISREKENYLRENEKLLNYGKKAEYRTNCIYIMGLDKAQKIINALTVV